MTYEAKVNEFYSSFGLDAYPSTAVPDRARFPYIVYELPYGDLYNDASGIVNIYYHTESERIPNEKAQEIKDAIGSGITLKFDDGIVTIRKGIPEQNNLFFQDEPSTKLRVLNVTYSIIKNRL